MVSPSLHTITYLTLISPVHPISQNLSMQYASVAFFTHHADVPSPPHFSEPLCAVCFQSQFYWCSVFMMVYSCDLAGAHICSTDCCQPTKAARVVSKLILQPSMLHKLAQDVHAFEPKLSCRHEQASNVRMGKEFTAPFSKQASNCGIAD